MDEEITPILLESLENEPTRMTTTMTMMTGPRTSTTGNNNHVWVMDRFSKFWWIFLLRGIFQMGFGIFFLCYPGETWAVVSVTVGMSLILDGIGALFKCMILGDCCGSYCGCFKEEEDDDGAGAAAIVVDDLFPSRRLLLMSTYMLSFALNLGIGAFAIM
jgi:hypothetical protein